MNINKFKEAMKVFSLQQHQDALTYSKELEKLGWSFEDTEIYLKKDWQERTKQEELATRHIKTPRQGCPECPAQMFAYPINTEAGNQTNNLEENSVWLCQNPRCMHTIYNLETIAQLREV